MTAKEIGRVESNLTEKVFIKKVVKRKDFLETEKKKTQC
jgi:hypothetical protein